MKQWGFYFDQTRCVNCKACILACKSWNEDKRGDAAVNPELTWLTTGRYEEPAEYENLAGSTGEQNFADFAKYHMKENWRRVIATEYGDIPPNVDVLNLSISCNHCEEPVCVKACPMHYIYKETDFGIVLTDKNKTCISCQRCRQACPWGSPQYYDDNIKKFDEYDSAKPRMTKCDLCIDRIRDGLKPACVASCPMRALDAGPMDELKQRYPDWTDKVENFPDGGILNLDHNTKPNIIFKKKIRRV
ncbi:MAG: 4Fe-4S ferredoxin iron-sulfur binding domain protein [Clostridia bacterium]|nr:4Fe-4S ferredoxin iron-sulfur binding domain protein [Clostridia bacterium]